MKAPCPLFRKCSGCTLMQFPYVKQTHDKTKLAREELARFVPHGENVQDVIATVTASPSELGYRTSTKLCLHEDQFGRKSVGLYERGTKKVIAIPACPVHHPKINQLVNRFVSGRMTLALPFYNHAKRSYQAERLKFLTIRYCPDTDAYGVVISHTGVDVKELGKWAIEAAAANISIYEVPLAKSDSDLVLTERATHLAGPPDLPFAIGKMVYRLNPLAFFQANHSLTGRFVDHITSGTAGETLLDLYGGFGAYGLPMAKAFDKVFIVDANSSAIDAAKRAKKSYELPHATPLQEGVEGFLERRLTQSERQHVTHAIVNPPRSGLSERTRAALTGARYPRLTSLTYVSCNLDTLKRDLTQLTKVGGFSLVSAVPFDMFPQTDHLELVVKLMRRNAQVRPQLTKNTVPRANSGARSKRKFRP